MVRKGEIMEFFEFSAPVKAPDYLHRTAKSNYEHAVESIALRTQKLNEALKISGIKPETFQRLASKLFKDKELMYGNADYFDSKTPEEIASYVMSVYYPPVDDILDAQNRLVFPNADVICDTAFTTNEEWSGSLRKLGIGGSDGGVIQGVSHWGSLQTVYHSKVGTPVLIQDDSRNMVFERGHVLEDKVIAAFCKRTGAVRIRDTRMFRSKTHPHCIADIDAILKMPNDDIYIFEAKSTIKENTDAWRRDKIPASYAVQTRHYPAVLDDDRIKGTYIGCLFTVDMSIGGDYVGSQYDETDFLSRLVERDEDEEQELLDADEAFWKRYIESGAEPPRSGNTKLDLEVIGKHSGPADMGLQPLDIVDDRQKDAAKRYLELGEKISKIKKQAESLVKEQDDIKTEFVKLLGQFPEGRIDIGDGHYYEIKYSPVRKKKIDCELMEDQYPAAWAICPENPVFWTNFTDMYPEAAFHCLSEDTQASRRFSIKDKTIRIRK